MVSENFNNTRNKKYGSLNLKQIAQSVFKKTTEAGNVTVNILGALGIAGFKFHVPQTEVVKFENEITDHYTDTNSAIQDHIASRPITITVTGLVGDYFYTVNQIEDFLALITPTITLVKEFIPQFSKVTQAIKARKAAQTSLYSDSAREIGTGKLKGGLGQTVSAQKFNWMDLFSLFQSLYKIKSAQARAFIFFEALWKSKALFSVETTWKRYDNMVVQTIEPKRDNNADITGFTATFKQISTSETLVESMDEYYNRTEQAKSKTVDKGLEKGEKITILDGVTYA